MTERDRRGFLSDLRIERGPWQAFDRSIARLFEHIGFPHVALVDGSGDHGADIIVSDDSSEFVIQAKFKGNSSTVVSKQAVFELKSALDYYDIEKGYLVTNTKLSTSANELILELNRTGYNIEKMEGLDLSNFYARIPDIPVREYVPRVYQIRVLDSLWETYSSGRNRTMVALATGLGKTFVAGTFIKRVLHDKPGARILILADQKALIQQFDRALWKHLPKQVSTHIWDGTEEPSYLSGVLLATFQKMKNVMNSNPELGQFDIVIVDEAHHAPSSTYAEFLDTLSYNFLLGMTATPWRSDDRQLEDIFGPPCNRCTIDIIQALKNGYLSKVDYALLCDNLDWDLVHDKSERKYTIKDLNRRLFLPERDDRILDIVGNTWKNHDINRAIIYCASIEHAMRMETLLRERGYVARCIHSGLDLRETEERLRKFRQGKLQVLTAMNMLNEGVDIPEVDLIVFLRVTHSRIIFLQQLGRGLRLSKDKEKVIVLDFVADLKRVAAAIDINSKVTAGGQAEILNGAFNVNFSSSDAQGFFMEYLKDRATYVQDCEDDNVILFP